MVCRSVGLCQPFEILLKITQILKTHKRKLEIRYFIYNLIILYNFWRNFIGAHFITTYFFNLT